MSTQYMIIILSGLAAMVSCGIYIFITELTDPFRQAERARKIFMHFRDRANIAFGIGTYLSNDTCVPPLNIVMKTTACNGMDVAKISDTEGKGMCKNPEYIAYLQRCIDWRMKNEQ